MPATLLCIVRICAFSQSSCTSILSYEMEILNYGLGGELEEGGRRREEGGGWGERAPSPAEDYFDTSMKMDGNDVELSCQWFHNFW